MHLIDWQNFPGNGMWSCCELATIVYIIIGSLNGVPLPVSLCVSSIFRTYWDCTALCSGCWCALLVSRFMELGLCSESCFWIIFVSVFFYGMEQSEDSTDQLNCLCLHLYD